MLRGVVLLLGSLSCADHGPQADADQNAGLIPAVVTSPNGRIRAELLLASAGTARSVLHYRVTLRDRPVILASPLRVDLADGSSLGAECSLERVEKKATDERYRQHPGKRREVLNRCNEIVVDVRQSGKGRAIWQVAVRAHDDGVALQYRFPAQDGWRALAIARESTAFALPAQAMCWVLPLNGFTTSYEARYQKRLAAELPVDWLLGLPLLVELPGTGWAALTEANLTDYAGMYLAREAAGSGVLMSRLSPLPTEPGVAVRAALPHVSPWRVVMIAERPGQLIESDLLLNLNEPRAVEDVSWIRPGKTTFPWWNGYFEQGVPFAPGLNTATVKYYIDFCAKTGIPYHSLDGKDNVAWYGGPIVPYQGADPTRAIDGLDLPAVLEYARSKGIRLRFWMHWQAAWAHMARAFPLYRRWGVEGVMIDFMDRDDQAMVNFQRELLKTAAANRLTVTFHGVGKPTGLERTYPNLLTSEGVLNLEYDKWDPQGVPPEHELTVPFTRMLAGPLDFHQGSFRTVEVSAFKPRNEAPLIMGTPCRTLASYVVLQNHLPMVADYPSAYVGHAALDVLAQIPTTWDDTRVLSGAVGESIVIARRSGADWWVGAMTDRHPREIRVPLDFLKRGRFQAELLRDDLLAKYRLRRETIDVEAGSVIEAGLAAAGGLLIHLSQADARRAPTGQK
jgi:alpha-glucosidase